jgi:hypothetical protein
MMSSFSLGEVDRKRAGLPDLERQAASGIARSDAPASTRAASTPNRNPLLLSVSMLATLRLDQLAG